MKIFKIRWPFYFWKARKRYRKKDDMDKFDRYLATDVKRKEEKYEDKTIAARDCESN